LNSLNISQSGLRTLLGITEQQLNQLIGLDGLISYNRYRALYPGYTQPEDVWFLELNNGTLDIEIKFELRSKLGEIYYAAGTENSGMVGIDYIFFTTQDAAFNGLTNLQKNEYLTSGTIYIGSQNFSNDSMETLVIKYAGANSNTASLMRQIPGAFLNSGIVSTLKGALINPSSDPAHASGVRVFNSSTIYNHYHEIHRFKEWIVVSGLSDASGIFALDNIELKARFEPIPESTITTNSQISYLLNFNYDDFLNDRNIIRTVGGQELFNSGAVIDFFGTILPNQSIDYFNDYFIPVYEMDSPIYPSNNFNSGLLYINQEEFWNQGLRTISSRNLLLADYIDNIQYVNDPNAQSFRADLRGNSLQEWELFYMITDSGFIKVNNGKLISSGFTQSINSTSGLGYVQFTNPIEYRGFVNGSGFIFPVSTSPNLQPTSTWSFLGVQYSGVSATGGIGGGTNTSALFQHMDNILSSTENSVAVIALTSSLSVPTTVEEGGLLFVRQQVSSSTGQNVSNQFVYQKDNVNPIIQPIALMTSNPLRTVAKANDTIDIMIRANEPVIYSYTASSSAGVIFESSGITADFTTNRAFSSGLTTSCGNPSDCRVFVGSSYSTYLLNELRPTVASNDNEGFFNFSGLSVQDRAGNSTLINSDQFVGYSIWIDPVAPRITTSGFENSTITYSGNQEVSGLSTTPTSGVTPINLYLVSGVLNYNILMKETFNDITSGLVDWDVFLKPIAATSGLKAGQINAEFVGSGFGASTPAASGILPVALTSTSNKFLLNEGSHSGVTSGLVRYDLGFDTFNLENGLYMLTVEMTDYAGNFGVQVYYIYVVNPLQYAEVLVSNYESGILMLSFSSTIKLSGVLAIRDFTIYVDRPDTTPGTFTERITNLNNYEILDPNADGKTIRIEVFRDPSKNPFLFVEGDIVRVEITAAGVAKLFNTLDQPLVQAADNTRELSGNWPAAG
jgi:hypothetical protein